MSRQELKIVSCQERHCDPDVCQCMSHETNWLVGWEVEDEEGSRWEKVWLGNLVSDEVRTEHSGALYLVRSPPVDLDTMGVREQDCEVVYWEQRFRSESPRVGFALLWDSPHEWGSESGAHAKLAVFAEQRLRDGLKWLTTPYGVPAEFLQASERLRTAFAGEDVGSVASILEQLRG